LLMFRCTRQKFWTVVDLKEIMKKKMCRVVPNGVNVSNRWPAVSLPLQQPFD